MRAAIVRVTMIIAGLAACGGPGGPPTRGVVERDVGAWVFRRYQRLLDVEVWVKGNSAVAHGASYASLAAEKRGHLGPRDVVSAVVTRYQKDDGIGRALTLFARRLAQDPNYQVAEELKDGVRLIRVVGGGEAWVMWAARRHVIKLGGPGRADVPDELIAAYGERYASRLGDGALEGPMAPAAAGDERAAPPEPFDPDSPRPRWKQPRANDPPQDRR